MRGRSCVHKVQENTQHWKQSNGVKRWACSCSKYFVINDAITHVQRSPKTEECFILMKSTFSHTDEYIIKPNQSGGFLRETLDHRSRGFPPSLLIGWLVWLWWLKVNHYWLLFTSLYLTYYQWQIKKAWNTKNSLAAVTLCVYTVRVRYEEQ